MDLEFGKSVRDKAQELKEQGRDANQIAKVLFDQDTKGHNYGIGIVLDGDGKPLSTSSVTLDYVQSELGLSHDGNYMSSAKMMQDLKTAVLKWQRIPEAHWDNFQLALPSDAGTGAVKTAVELALLLNSQAETVGVEENGWPAYRAISKTARVGFQEYSENVIHDKKVLTIYQAGPMNTTGQVKGKDVILSRAEAAQGQSDYIILDRAYSGFEFASQLASESYDWVMQKSYELQIQPYIDAKVPFFISLSPTKAFITFALRPCGLLLLYTPDASKNKGLTNLINTTIRARGSSFEHPITRAFAKAMVDNLAGLEAEHKHALERLAESEALWRKLVQGTAIEYLYSDDYAGLFRNPPAKEDAAVHLYNAHLYPVFANNRCRQNVTGIPNDEALAQQHVAAFTEQCY